MPPRQGVTIAGRLSADIQIRRQVIFDALAVLDSLPDPGTGLARLASRVLGNAHALDDGPVQATVLRALAWLSEIPDSLAGSARRRALWASAGVALDTVSSTVLVLSLTLPGEGPMVTGLTANTQAGLPARFTLGQVRHYLDAERVPGTSGLSHVFVCENPSVVETAADVLGAQSAPLVCVEGRPSVAAALLLRELRDGGSALHYHGDFDWSGLAIAKPFIASGALPWRFSAPDYDDGLSRNHRLKRLLQPGSPVVTPWDPSLADTMLTHRIAVEEEAVIDHLLSDLSSRNR